MALLSSMNAMEIENPIKERASYNAIVQEVIIYPFGILPFGIK